MIISLHEVKLLPLCLLQKCAIAHFFIDQIVAKRLLSYRFAIFYNRNIIHQKKGSCSKCLLLIGWAVRISKLARHNLKNAFLAGLTAQTGNALF